MGSDPKPPLVVRRSAVRTRPNSRFVRCDVELVREVLAWLTEGASEREPELRDLALEAVRAMVTGLRAEELRALYDVAYPEARRHCESMDVLFVAANLPYADANDVRASLSEWDAAFAQLSDASIAWALRELGGAESASKSPRVLAHLCVECGAFGVPRDSSEEALQRAINKLKQSRARLE